MDDLELCTQTWDTDTLPPVPLSSHGGPHTMSLTTPHPHRSQGLSSTGHSRSRPQPGVCTGLSSSPYPHAPPYLPGTQRLIKDMLGSRADNTPEATPHLLTSWYQPSVQNPAPLPLPSLDLLPLPHDHLFSWSLPSLGPLPHTSRVPPPNPQLLYPTPTRTDRRWEGWVSRAQGTWAAVPYAKPSSPGPGPSARPA